MSGDVFTYPLATTPLDGTERVLAGQNGKTVGLTVDQLSRAVFEAPVGKQLHDDRVAVEAAAVQTAADRVATTKSAGDAAASALSTRDDRIVSAQNRAQTTQDRAAADVARAAAQQAASDVNTGVVAQASADAKAAKTASEAARDQSGAYAGQAAGSLAQTQAIAANAGSMKRYTDLPAANAALGVIANGEFIEVQNDSTHGGRIARYHKAGGVLVFDNLTDSGPRFIYLKKGQVGTGATPDSCVGTVVAAMALAAAAPGSTVRGSGRFFGEFRSGAVQIPKGTQFEPFDGELIFDGSRPIDGTTIQPHATLPNVYFVDVAHDLDVYPNIANGSPVIGADCCHFAMWLERMTVPYAEASEFCLEGDWSGGSIAANEAFVGANPGFCTVYRPGTAIPDARIDFANNANRPAGTVYRYVFQLPDSGDPRMNNRIMYYAEQEKVLRLNNGCGGRDFTVQRTAAKDLCGNDGHYGAPLVRMKMKGAAVHGFVGPNYHADGYATARVTSKQFNGGGYHGFFGSSSDAAGTLPSWGTEKCKAYGFGFALYSHGDGAKPEYDVVMHRDFECYDCTAAVTTGVTNRGWFVHGLKAIRCDSFFASGGPGITITDFVWTVGKTPMQRAMTSYDCPINLKNGLMISNTTQTRLINAGGNTQCPFRTKNVVSIGGQIGEGGTSQKFEAVFEDSIIEGVPADAANFHLTAKNSYVTLALLQGQYSRQDMVEGYGWNLDATSTSAWVRQTLTYTVEAGDITNGRFNKVLFPAIAGTVRPYETNNPYNPSDDVVFETPKLFAAGMYVRVGGKVVQIVTYTVATGRAKLDQKVQFVNGGAAYNVEKNLGNAVLPRLPVAFGFASRSEYYNALAKGPTYSTTGSTTTNGGENMGTSSFNGTAGYRASTGLASQLLRLNHQNGEIDEGFAVAAGDTITVGQTVYVPELAPVFVSDPRLTGRPDLAAGNLLAARGMGVRV